ncbi:MAG: magnesium chelatase subunit D family protein, partial [Desulfarculaceae bacterium]
LNSIDPLVGGVLVRGEKGTAKSTTVRSLAACLPGIKVSRGCPFGCDPDDNAHLCGFCRQTLSNGGLRADMRRTRVVELPLNATEDMVLGGIDFSRAVKTGQRSFSPGLLARAHRGYMYVDEVNLLDDHLVDVVLDAAASGVHIVEREGISFAHPSRFVLVGTMNPEEGELRPQLLDRFGLCVQVQGEQEPEARVRVMELREDYDLDPADFSAAYHRPDQQLAQSINKAQDLLPRVILPQRMRSFISEICLNANVAGHRADLVIERAAKSLAAYEGRTEVSEEDISRVAPMALRHRSRDALPPPPPPPPPPEDESDQEPPPPDQENEPPEADGDDQDQQGPDEMDEEFTLPLPEPPEPQTNQDQESGNEQTFETGESFKVKSFKQPKDRHLRRGSGRRSLTRTAQKQGRYVKSIIQGDPNDLALDATLRAAAPYQCLRTGQSRMAVYIKKSDIRCKVREKRVGNFLVFAVDASGSMGVRARMVATKGAILSLLLDAYQKRDKVALITFKGRESELTLPPTSSIEMAARLLREMPVGGRTPLVAGLIEVHKQVQLQVRKDPTSRPIVIILTDGKANVGTSDNMPPHEQALKVAERMAGDGRVRFVVVDTEPAGVVRLDLAQRLAAALGGSYFRIEDLKAEDLVAIARSNNQ